MAGIYLLGYRLHYAAGHRTTRRIAVARLADHNDTGIFRFVGREIAAEGNLVSCLAVNASRSDLSRTGLTGNTDKVGMDGFTGSFLHYA